MSTWNELLASERKSVNDETPIVAKSGTQDDWTRAFGYKHGDTVGSPVLAWSEARVYFPVIYDSMEWLESAPRHPQTDGQYHVGR